MWSQCDFDNHHHRYDFLRSEGQQYEAETKSAVESTVAQGTLTTPTAKTKLSKIFRQLQSSSSFEQ
jgi:hypothetical protein